MMNMLDKPPLDISTSSDTGFDYQILDEGYESTGQWKSGEEIRMDYLSLTDKLIHTITEGIEVIDEKSGKTTKQPYSTVVFLDKSARPISHFVRECWPLFAKDIQTGDVPPMPSFKFLNIDRRQWVDQVDPNGSGILEPNRIHESFIWSLRSIFLTSEGKRQVQEEGLTKAVEEMPARLDNETILVVDETYFSGETLRIASSLIGRAFPEATVGATHWMKETVDGVTRNPLWYSDRDSTGRGIGDRYVEQKQLTTPSANYTRKFGRWFLSSPPKYRDEKYLQLVKEAKALAANPDVPLLPYNGRHDIEERIISYNTHGQDPSEFTPLVKSEIIKAVISRKKAVRALSNNFGIKR